MNIFRRGLVSRLETIAYLVSAICCRQGNRDPPLKKGLSVCRLSWCLGVHPTFTLQSHFFHLLSWTKYTSTFLGGVWQGWGAHCLNSNSETVIFLIIVLPCQISISMGTISASQCGIKTEYNQQIICPTSIYVLHNILMLFQIRVGTLQITDTARQC